MIENSKIVIVDYGMGNLHNLQRILSRFARCVIISNRGKDVADASHIVLPGVGHFGKAMERLHQNDLVGPLNQAAIEENKPVLGICLGMQLMTAYSAEGNCEGLAWFSCKTEALNHSPSNPLRSVHIGWNSLYVSNQNSILSDVSNESEFYFVHEYAVLDASQTEIICKTHYGNSFISGFQKGNITGLQFHPEKSHGAGHLILSKFIQSCTDPE